MKRENILLQGTWDLSYDIVIDYIIGSEEMRERIKKLKVGYKTDTDHQPIEAVIKKGRKNGVRGTNWVEGMEKNMRQR